MKKVVHFILGISFPALVHAADCASAASVEKLSVSPQPWAQAEICHKTNKRKTAGNCGKYWRD